MDLHTVTRYRAATTRADLALSPGEAYLAGGTWLYSEPQPGVTGLVDLTGMGWPAWEELDSGDLRIGATCTIAELAALSTGAGARRWTAAPLFAQCASALLASFKVLGMATVGGNICRSFAAASMVSLAVALDGVAVVWGPDGRDHRVRVGELITGNGTNALRPRRGAAGRRTTPVGAVRTDRIPEDRAVPAGSIRRGADRPGGVRRELRLRDHRRHAAAGGVALPLAAERVGAGSRRRERRRLLHRPARLGRLAATGQRRAARGDPTGVRRMSEPRRANQTTQRSPAARTSGRRVDESRSGCPSTDPRSRSSRGPVNACGRCSANTVMSR